MDDLCFDDLEFVQKELDDEKYRKKLIDHGLIEVSELPDFTVDAIGKEDKCSVKSTVKRKRGRPRKDNDLFTKPMKEIDLAVADSFDKAVKKHYPEIDRQRKTIDKHKNVTTELLMNTEQYRINEIFALLKVTLKDTTRQQAVRYLLSYSDLLDKDMAREVIDMANKMLTDETVRDTVKVKIASDLKAFLGTAGKKKFVRSTFEELRKEDGFLEVEVPD